MFKADIYKKHKSQFTSMNALNAYIYGGKGKVEILSLSGSSYKFSYAFADRAEDFDNFPLFVYYIDEEDLAACGFAPTYWINKPEELLDII